MATVATISVNFAQYDSTSFTSTGVIDRSINPKTLSQYCLGTSSGDLSYLGGFVKKTGDTMSGYLTLPTANPTLVDHATRKGYVDSRIDSLSATVNSTGAGGFVRISGSTMVGDLILNTSTPSVALQASSKGYVDSRITSLSSTVDTKLIREYLAKAGGTMSGEINMGGYKIISLKTPESDSDAATKKYVDGAVTTATTDAATKTYVDQQDALKVTKAGDTMGGRLGLSLSGFHVATKDNISTRIDSGFYQTSVAKTSTGWPVETNDYYHLLTSTHSNDNNYYSMQFASSFFDSKELYYRATNSNTKTTAATWNKIFHSGNTNTLSLIGYQPVNKAGDTMLGPLNLKMTSPIANADGTEATSKKYVDDAVAAANAAAGGASSSAATKVSKSGDTMTGPLFLGSTSSSIVNERGSVASIASSGGGTGTYFEQRSSGSGVTTNAAYITFHRPNSYAVKFGLDIDNKLKVGGWSLGVAAYEILNENNFTNFAPKIKDLEGYLKKDGAFLNNGAILSLGREPTEQDDATTKKYVDKEVATKTTSTYVDQEAGKRVLKTGDTMSGDLSISKAGAPTLQLRNTLAGATNYAAFIGQSGSFFQIRRGQNTATGADLGPNGRDPLMINFISGDMTVSGDVTAYSDSRLKKNIISIENALDKTLKLEGVSFEKIETSKKGIGLIAQKVKEVLPEVVTEDNDGYLAVSYGNIVGLLVEAIKELNAKVEKLENKNK